MKYEPPIKGKILKKETPKNSVGNFADQVGNVGALVSDLNNLKRNVIQTFDAKVEEIDERIHKVENITEELCTVAEEVKSQIKLTQDEALEVIREIKQGEKGEKGENGYSPDPEEIAEIVLSKMPRPEKIDLEKFEKRILSKIPDRKADLKVIQESIEVDPMSVIEKIMELPEEKRKRLKLKTENIDGLEQTMRAFQSQLGRGYLHGGGISNITGLIEAGTNVTITGSGTKEDPYVINATGGGGVTDVTATYPILSSGGTTPNISMSQPQSTYIWYSDEFTGDLTGDPRHTIDSAGRTNLQMALGGSLSTQVIVTDNILSAGIPGSALVISDSMAGDNASFGVVDASSLGGDPFAVNAQVAMPSINLDAIFAMGQHGIDLVWDYDTTDDIATGLQMNESILAGNPGAGLFRINTTTSDTAFVAVLDETGSGGDPLTFHAGYLQGTTNVVNDIIADSTGVYINAADNANSILGKVSVEPNGSAILGAYDLANGYESSVTPDISHGRINSTIIDATATSLFQQLSTQLSYAVGGNLYLDIDVGNLSYAIGDINFNGNGTYTTWDDQNQAILNILDGEYTITNTAQTARVALFQPHVRAAIGDIDAVDSQAIVDVDVAGGNIFLYGYLHIDRGDAGSTGNVTLNYQAGTVLFAAGMTDLTVTNNRVISSSEILVSVSSNDATMKSVSVVKSVGSFKIYPNALPTGQTAVTFLVLN